MLEAKQGSEQTEPGEDVKLAAEPKKRTKRGTAVRRQPVLFLTRTFFAAVFAGCRVTKSGSHAISDFSAICAMVMRTTIRISKGQDFVGKSKFRQVAQGTQPQILLVEGESRDGQWLRNEFEESGLLNIAQVVSTTAEALASLRGEAPFKDAVQPSLVLLHLCLPETPERPNLSTELELLAEMKSDDELRVIPVVIVTNGHAEADVLNAYSHGACSFVCKPESEADRRTLIQRFAMYWSHVARLPSLAGPDSPGHAEFRLSEPNTLESTAETRPIEVLIVDDSDDDVVLLKEAFVDCPLVNFVETVNGGEEALCYLRGEMPYQNSRRPGLVLMDINMPRKSGFEVLAEMRADERLARVPVVMLTSSKQESDILHAYANGACSFISKPFDFDQMRDVARHFALYWALVADIPDSESSSA